MVVDMTGDGTLRATLFSFGARLLHRWYVVLFGVVLGVLGGLSNPFDWKLKLEPWMAYGIVATSLFAAALWAAFDMVSERDRAIARLRRQAPGGADPRYDSVSDTLGRSTAVAVELSKEGALIALDAWEVQTRPIVAAAYGEGEATQRFHARTQRWQGLLRHGLVSCQRGATTPEIRGDQQPQGATRPHAGSRASDGLRSGAVAAVRLRRL
jgi:hypothetical protein